MKVTSGMTRPLSGPAARCLGSADSSPALGEACPGLASTASRPRGGAPKRRHRLTLLSLVASAALLGCSSLTPEPWRVAPTFRFDNGSDKGNTAQGYLALARRFESEERLAQALDAYRKAALMATDDADVQNAVGVALALHGQFSPAVLAMRRAAVLAPHRTPLLNNLGYALLLDGRAEEARAIFRLTLAMEPTYGPALNNLAHLDQKVADPAAQQAATPLAMPAAPAEPALPGLPAVSAAATVATVPAAAAVAQEVVSAGPQVAPTLVPTVAMQTPVVAHARLDGVSIEIINGNGINGVAARMRGLLRESGIDVGRLANRLPYDSAHTRVYYQPGMREAAQQLAERMPVGAEVAPAAENSTRADLSVVLGHDVRRSAGCTLLAACAAPDRLVSSVELPAHSLQSGTTLRR